MTTNHQPMKERTMKRTIMSMLGAVAVAAGLSMFAAPAQAYTINCNPVVDGVLKARKCGDDSAALNSFCTLNKMTNLKNYMTVNPNIMQNGQPSNP
jgi:hypothetical protein